MLQDLINVWFVIGCVVLALIFLTVTMAVMRVWQETNKLRYGVIFVLLIVLMTFTVVFLKHHHPAGLQ